MFKEIFLFELWYRLRRPATYIYFVIFFLVGLLYGSILSGALGPEAAGQLSGGGKNNYNSPYVIHLILLSIGQFSLFAVAAIMAVPVYRDFQYQAHELFFTKPLSKAGYLGGRFLGSLVITLPVIFSLALGLMLAYVLPGADKAKLGPFHLWHYINPYLLHLIPFTLFTSSIFFATVSLSRQQVFIYLNAIMVLVLLSAAGAITSQLDNKVIAALIDPTGGAAFQNATEFWTVTERNTLTIPYTAITVGNQLIWLVVAAAIWGFTFWRFSFSYSLDGGGSSSKTPVIKQIGDTVTIQKVNIPKVGQAFGLGQQLSLLGRLIRDEVRVVLRSPIFWAIVLVGVLFIALLAAFSGQLFGTSTWPVTYQVLDIAQGNFFLFVLAIIIFYSGEMVWRERDAEVNQIYDALPIPNWLTLAAKFLAMTAVLLLLMVVVMACGLVIQMVQGYFRFEIGLYIQNLFGYRFINFLLFAVLAFFIQTLSDNKYLGFFLTILVFLFFTIVLDLLGVEDNLFSYMSSTQLTYSDMNGFGHFTGPFLLFKLYWSGFALMMAALAGALWVRGAESDIRSRWKQLRQRMTPATWATLGAGLLIFVASGAYIFYNTHILNEFVSSRESQRLQAESEKTYKKYENALQPRIRSVSLNVNLYPERRGMEATGRYSLQNPHSQPIDSIHVTFLSGLELKSVQFDRPSEQVWMDEDNGYAIYRLKEALAPGDSIQMDFSEVYETTGFANSGSNTQLVENGTFINQYYFPAIGYDRNFELEDPDLRKKYGLGERLRFPSIEDSTYYSQNLLSNDADWIEFEATVSTLPDQIAITPGYLQKEWTEGGRRYFQYKMDSRMLKFYSIVSARYEVKRDTWQAPDGREVRLEIYYHKGHEFNLDRMMDAMKKSLSYFSTAFGYYPHQQARILEFPRYQSFAQSFANTIPYSESIGFIAKVGEEDVDYPFYITAHELAHQWWPHQVLPAYVQGFQFLSETLAQYSALMVMEKEFGKEQMKKYLRYELNNYLRQRTGERVKELPALLSENQTYIHYNKGSLIMYALKDYIGEDSLNAALKRYLDDSRFGGPPYVTTRDWMKYVQAVTPDSLKSVLTDMFETITLFDIKTDSAAAVEKDSVWTVKLNVVVKKYRDNGTGEETEIPANDYIDIGIFGKEKINGKWEPKTLYLQRHHIQSDSLVLEVQVREKPSEAGIDPLHKLIDRKPDDNTRRITLNP